MEIERRNSLSYKQAMITVLTVFVIGLVFSLYQITEDLKQEKMHMDQTVNQVLRLLAFPAAQAAFNLDNNLARQVVQGLFEYAPVYQAEIKDDLGGVLAVAERTRSEPALRYVANLLLGESKQYQLPLAWEQRSQPVGMVTVLVDPYLVSVDFFDRAGRTLLFGTVSNLILALFLSVIFYFTLTKPLVKTAASFSNINPVDSADRMIRMPQGHKHDEIGLLVITGNRVIDQYRRHIQQQEESEAELNRLRNLFSNVVDSMPSALICVDIGLKVIQWNHQAEVVSGLTATEAIGQDLVTAYPLLEPEMQSVKRAIANGLSAHDRRVMSDVNDEVHLYDLTIYPLTTNGIEGAVIRIDDVTERVRIEEMMIQSEKMLSIGGLAAGMAHEINNPLAGILQNIQVIENRIKADLPVNREVAEASGTSMDAVIRYLTERKVYDMMGRVRESGKRAAKIVENMLDFSRKSSQKNSPQAMPELIERCLDLAANDYSMDQNFDFRQIKIIKEYAADLPLVSCESSQIQQVILNLLKNGAQAMAENRLHNELPLFIIRLQVEADFFRIEIEDNGPGISPEMAKRIFEPFFTTKPIGVGTGLGLSVSYFIITENYGGELAVESAPAGGARFILRLPINPTKAVRVGST
ncbi:MAG: ATP-binding protein [Sedimenticola sp.]|nr:ATP-binding protein [Sedimenticola sp.]